VKQIELLRFAIEALERLDIPYAVVGSYASSAWGEPRMTRDIDVVIQLSAEQVAPLCAEFPDADFYVSQSAALEAVQHRSQFNVIHPESGSKIDFMMMGESNWSAEQLRRRQQIQFDESTRGFVASPEDVILGKLLYLQEGGSEKHIRDINGILSVHKALIDLDYISRIATQLDALDIWKSIIQHRN
jgi:hypothetical protein